MIFNMIKFRLLMISICVFGFAACNTGTQKKMKDGIPDTKSKDYVFIIKNKTKLEIGESFELKTEINAPVYWLLPDNVKEEGQSVNISFSNSGRKEIKMIAKETGEILAKTSVIVKKKQLVIAPPPPPAKKPNALLQGTSSSVSKVKTYQRHFKSQQQMVKALEQLANSGIGKREKRDIRKQVLADLDQGAKVEVDGIQEEVSIYLRNLILQASEYKNVQIKLDWVVNSKTNRISQIIIL